MGLISMSKNTHSRIVDNTCCISPKYLEVEWLNDDCGTSALYNRLLFKKNYSSDCNSAQTEPGVAQLVGCCPAK